LKVEARLEFKYGTVYREVIRLPKIVWCYMMNSDSFANKILSQLIDIIRETAPQVLHKCPYRDFIVNNMTLQIDSLKSIFPTGDYKFVAIVSNKEDDNIFTLSVLLSISSKEKDTFG